MSNSTISTNRRDALVQGSEAQAVRTSHPPQPPWIAKELQNRHARTSLPDRVAMKIGLWLLLWGTRPATGRPNTSDLHQRHLERALLEHQMELDRIRAWAGLHGTQFGR
ncbi:hypothetical protein [Microbacterium paludicola]|uniref:Uncharacterized protein n=1 Tax=Microbacterium paludicola TaxID=300019 RepID=A0A4Y9G1E9_9MICO|nr:hypothetical protein [Microbacterium paludicola]MBF0814816.1 hypothetical protein [Microbacterium paludicola]TFU34560.1 hypothetical protein E4U02_00120 [Microbacterium paludicola]